MSEICKIHMNMFYHFWSLIDYLNMILNNSSTIEKSEMESRLKDIKEPKKQYFISEELNNYFDNEFPHLTTSSIIINLFSRIEVCLRQLCKELESKYNLNYKYNDINGSILQKTKEFYKKNNLRGYSTETHEFFCSIQKIRDCFVHCNGDLNESRDKEYLLNLISKGKLKILNYGISVEIDYCKDILIKSKDMMVEVYSKSGFPMIIE